MLVSIQVEVEPPTPDYAAGTPRPDSSAAASCRPSPSEPRRDLDEDLAVVGVEAVRSAAVGYPT